MQKINEQKLQAFAIGTMGQRPLSKREQEERRKKEEEKAAANVSYPRGIDRSAVAHSIVVFCRYSRSLWRHSKRHRRVFQKFGSKLELMMLDRDVSALVRDETQWKINVF